MATWPTGINDDGTNTTGTILDAAYFDAIKAYIDAQLTTIGDPWIDVPFSAANFGAGGAMTWTVEAGDVLQNRYKQIGKTILWSVYLFTTTIGGTASNQLRINLPIPATTARTQRFNAPMTFVGDGGTNVAGIVETTGNTYVTISKINQANFTPAANACHLAFTLVFEIF